MVEPARVDFPKGAVERRETEPNSAVHWPIGTNGRGHLLGGKGHEQRVVLASVEREVDGICASASPAAARGAPPTTSNALASKEIPTPLSRARRPASSARPSRDVDGRGGVKGTDEPRFDPRDRSSPCVEPRRQVIRRDTADERFEARSGQPERARDGDDVAALGEPAQDGRIGFAEHGGRDRELSARDKLPPMTAVPRAAAAAACPRASCSSSPSVKARGSTKAESTPRGLAPMAAKSLAAAMSDRQPRSRERQPIAAKMDPFDRAIDRPHQRSRRGTQHRGVVPDADQNVARVSRRCGEPAPQQLETRKSSLTADHTVRGAPLSDKPAGDSWSSR